jgi:hypothetical protein
MRMHEIFYSCLMRLCHLNFHSACSDVFCTLVLFKFFLSVLLSKRHKKWVFLVSVPTPKIEFIFNVGCLKQPT